MPKTDRLSPGAVRFLQEPHLAHVATLMADGSPQSSITWVDVEPDGSHVLINTGTKRVKLRNVRRDPRVAISVVDNRDPWRWIEILGEVVELTQEGADEHIGKLALKYTGRQFGRPDASDPRWRWRIRPTTVVESKLGNPS